MENAVLQTAPSFVCLLTENNIWSFIKEFASPVIALLAFVFTIYTHIKTQKLIYPFQRPIIGIDETNVEMSEGAFGEDNKYLYNFFIKLRNKGQHPAQDLIMKINYQAPNKKELTFQSANRIDQNSTYVAIVKVYKKSKFDEDDELFLKLNLKYKDLLQQENEYEENHWYKFVGGNEMRHATIEEKELIEEGTAMS